MTRPYHFPDDSRPNQEVGKCDYYLEYDNGFGSTVGRFKIDLYKSEGSGDRGSKMTTICNKPNVGCRDTSESRVDAATSGPCLVR